MVVWRHLPFTFRVKNKNGIIPQKTGQDGGHADQINQYESINGRNFAQRVRRSKQRKLQNYKYVSIPTPRPARELRNEVQQKLDSMQRYLRCRKLHQ